MEKMITGARNGGAVRHYGHTHVSLCGRYMVVGAGESLRDCRSCVRVGKLVTTENASELETLAATRFGGSIEKVRACVAKGRSYGELTFIKQILRDPSELDPGVHALYMLITDKGATNGDMTAMYRDPAKRGGKGGDGMVDPKNAKPARSILTDNQRNALIKMDNFQISLIKEIRELQDEEYITLAPIGDEFFAQFTNRKEIDKAFTSLSAAIDKLKAKRDELKRDARKAVRATVDETITAGMYKVGETIYRVKPTQAGKLWAHKLIGSTEDGWEFKFAGNPRHFVKAENKMTLEEAKQFGKITGTCCVCSKLLTKQSSIDAGIGPVCASSF